MAAMVTPLLPLKSFRERLLDLASEHEALQRQVQSMEIQSLGGIPEKGMAATSTHHTQSEVVSLDPQFDSTPRAEPRIPSPRGQQARFRLTGAASAQASGKSDAKVVMEEQELDMLWVQPVSAMTQRSIGSSSLTPRTKARIAHRCSHKPSATDKENQYWQKEAEDVWAILDAKKSGLVSAIMLVDMLTALLSSRDCHIFRSEAATELFMLEVAERFDEFDDHESHCMTKDNFMHVMLDDPLSTFGIGLSDKVLMFRDAMFSIKFSYLVVCKAYIGNGNAGIDILGILQTLGLQDQKKSCFRQYLDWLDPFVMAVIILNAVMIGMSYDVEPDSRVWDSLEFGFTAFFLAELLIKLTGHGFVEHFFGGDWHWNLFDATLVLLALIGCIVTTIAIAMEDNSLQSNLSHLTLLRIGRLMRISRLLRLLHSKMLRELTLMVNGLLYGLRTIVWAIVLLVVVSYCLALLFRQMTDGDDSLSELFETVPVAMLTVYRCFIGDCSTETGVPLAHTLYEKYGWAFSLFYMLSTMIITFGLFNLIMAIFVESTLANAKTEERKRRMNFSYEKLRVAKKIHMLVMGIIRAPSSPKDAIERQGLRLCWRHLLDWMWPQDDHAHQRLTRDCITRESFERALLEPDMQAILEDDLDVSFEDTGKIFDALDANGDGRLQIMELVEGLMSLRGHADKLDMLEIRSAVRHTQVVLTELKELSKAPRYFSTAGSVSESLHPIRSAV